LLQSKYNELALLTSRLGLGAAIAGEVAQGLATAATAITPFTTQVNRAFSRTQFFISMYGFDQVTR
jgi:hypothetical protein